MILIVLSDAKEGSFSVEGKEQVIAFDPDLRKSGVAIFEHGKLQGLHSVSLWAVPELLKRHPQAVLVLEDVNACQAVFARKGASILGSEKEARKASRIGQNVGQAKAVALLLEELFTREKRDFVKVKPLKGFFKQAKRDKDLFKRLTGWQGRSNADTRDAAMLGMYYVRSSARG